MPFSPLSSPILWNFRFALWQYLLYQQIRNERLSSRMSWSYGGDEVKARKEGFAHRSYFVLLAWICAAALLMLPPKASGARARSEGARNQNQAGAQAGATSSAKPNLGGTWKLNKDQSDDPREKMREAMGGAAGGQEGGNGGARREPGANRPGRGAGPGGGMMAEWSQLTINQADSNVKVTGTSGRLLASIQPPPKPDNSDNEAGMGGLRMQPAKAQWQGNQLVAQSQGFGGGNTTRTFGLSPDGKQLVVTTKIENQRLNEPVTYKLVYDAGKADSNTQ